MAQFTCLDGSLTSSDKLDDKSFLEALFSE